MMDMNKHWLLGIDGGGTKTAFRLAHEDGSAVRDLTLGPCNPNDIGMDNALALLKAGIDRVCKDIPLSEVTAFAGISGGISGDNPEKLNAFFSGMGFCDFFCGSDIENLIGLSVTERCVLVIMGTGFVVFAADGDKRRRISGWGQFFDEGGSGYTLGRDAVCAVLCHGDGSGKPTLLTPILEETLGMSAREHLAEFYRRGKSYIASFSSLVFRGAELGDEVAAEILEKNMAFAAEKIKVALEFIEKKPGGLVPVYFTGGLCAKDEVLFPIINRHLPEGVCRLMKTRGDPLDGAVNMAMRLRKKFKEQKNAENRNAK